MYACYACGNEITDRRTRCACGADLTLLSRLDALADAWFNRGLEALRNGQVEEALACVSACCAARPSDAPARMAQARLWGQLGRPVAGLAALEQARQLDPDLPGLDDAAAALVTASDGSVSTIEGNAHE